MKIIQIDGFKGIIMAIFVISCLFAGFVLFPGVVAKYIWNSYLTPVLEFPKLNLFQGVLLWGITAISYYILAKGCLPISFKAPDDIPKDELDMIMKRAALRSKIKNMSSKIISYEEFKNEIKKANSINKTIESNKSDNEINKNVK